MAEGAAEQMSKYGIPYKGSKSKIAENILAKLPSGHRLVDLFGGEIRNYRLCNA
jgi:hypothetical protein